MSQSWNLKRKFIPTLESKFNDAKKIRSNAFKELSTKSSLNSSNQSFESNNFPSFNTQTQFTSLIPQEFPFSSESSCKKFHGLSSADLELELIKNRPKFHARPVPKFPPAPEPIKQNIFTIPQEFNLLTSSRTRGSSIFNENVTCFSAKPCPNFSKKFELKKNENNVTIPQPFALETATRHREIQNPEINVYKFV